MCLPGLALPCNRATVRVMEQQAMTVRLPVELYEWLRREAFDTREPMSAIVLAALERLRDERTGEQ